MANEAVIIELPESETPIYYTCADGTNISRMTLLKLTDPRTASASTAKGDYFAGIAYADKVANDGSTRIGAYVRGIFDLTANDTITAGQLVVLSGANLICAATPTSLSGQNLGLAVGKALESSAAGTSEAIAVAIGVY